MGTDRIIGELNGEMPGPLVICIAGMHGNEPQGIYAFQEILESIKSSNITVKGKIIGLLGNIEALKVNQRFIDYDLNRCWVDGFLKSIFSGQKQPHSEDQNVVELNELIEKYLDEDGYTEKVIIDLHTTSSDNGNFIVVPEDEGNHPVIKALHLPVVIDLDKYLEGTLLAYFHKKGIVSFAFEGGLMGTKDARELHKSGVWEVLDAAGSISHHDHHDLDHYENKLRAYAEGLPSTVKAFYRHWVEPEDDFVMNPGYSNFQKVTKGEKLAKDKHGPIVAPEEGLIFMPLYQKEGNDGFFIVNEV